MNAQARILEWPAVVEDDDRMALWNAIEIARAVKGTANANFIVSHHIISMTYGHAIG